MHMPIGTINDTTWAGAKAQPSESKLRARTYFLPRPAGAFLAVELTLLAIVLLQATRGGNTLGVAVMLVTCGIFFHLSNLNRSIVSSKSSTFSISVLESTALGLLAAALLFYLLPALTPNLEVALAGVALVGLLPVIMRWLLGYLVDHQMLVERTLIVGTGGLAERLHRVLANSNGNLNVTEDQTTGLLGFPECPSDRGVTIELAQLHEMVARNRISRVIVAERDAPIREKLAAVLLDSRLLGLEVNDAVDFYERFSGRLWVEALNPEWFVYSNGFKRSKANQGVKRFFDVTCALLVLLLATPLLAFVAIVIRLDSPGPALFRQIRVGIHGKTFVIYKLRSMRQDAELESGPVWAGERDERVTKVGRVLRKFRVDELLQAINVLRGEMSLVGPRPERPFFVHRLEEEIPFYTLRHYVKPGITGWAQVMYPYGASVEDANEKLQYDLYYAKHESLCFDAGILLKTVKIVLFGRGR